MVSFCSLKSSLPNTCTVLIFFIAGLLLCLEHVEHWERIASRWRPAFSSHLINAETGKVEIGLKTTCTITRLHRSSVLKHIAHALSPNLPQIMSPILLHQ